MSQPPKGRPLKLGVLVSGRGSNLAALLAARDGGRLPDADFRLVLSNKPGVRALGIARDHGVEAGVIPHKDFAGDRVAHDRAMIDRLHAAGCEGVVLAGYMRLIGRAFLDAFPAGVVNVHPALLPAFPGVDAQQQALDYGVRVTGCTVHFVDDGVDTGPIIAQRTVPVLADDTHETLCARLLVEEHAALVEAVSLWGQRRLERRGRHVIVHPGPT